MGLTVRTIVPALLILLVSCKLPDQATSSSASQPSNNEAVVTVQFRGRMSRSHAVDFMEALDQRMSGECDVVIDSAELNSRKREQIRISRLLFPITCKEGGTAISRYNIRNAVRHVLESESTDVKVDRVEVRPQ